MSGRLWLFAAVLAGYSFGVGCGSAIQTVPPPAPEAVAGTWTIADGSDVVVRVRLPGPVVEADDFDVSGVTFDPQKRHLTATFRYRQNGVTTTSDLVLVGAARMEGTVSGAYRGRETWLRIEGDAGADWGR